MKCIYCGEWVFDEDHIITLDHITGEYCCDKQARD
jgi:hypothetical protein